MFLASLSVQDEDSNIKMHDLVEAYQSHGWWHGVVSSLRNPATGLYTVSFPNSREVFQFKPAELRPQLDYVNGKWVPVLGQAQVQYLRVFQLFVQFFFSKKRSWKQQTTKLIIFH